MAEKEQAERAQRHLWIVGKVQGVWYRAWTEREATAHGLDGWVRNRSTGAVEAVLAGPPTQVTAMITACHDGPPDALVTDIRVSDYAESVGTGFSVRDTA